MHTRTLIGIRREDKSKWEARAPLTPADVHRLSTAHGLEFQVQTSPVRRFRDEEYTAAGAEVTADLRACAVVLGVKEIPVRHLEPQKTYVFFSHTIKHQPANMPMLRRLAELGCTLIDYEKIVDDKNRRLVFFGRYAGLAGMIDALWALGRRWQHEGHNTPLLQVRRAYEYQDLEHAKREIAAIGEELRRSGLPPGTGPLVIGFTGYGNVSQGAQEIANLLPMRAVAPDELGAIAPTARECYLAVFREEHMVELTGPGAARAAFDLQDYYQHPEKYRAKFFPALRHLTVMVNCIYWEPKYPRLVTCAQLRELWSAPQPPRLRVIADITCDIDGSVECTVKPTEPGEPTFVYEPATGQIRDGLLGDGPVILAVDILPCELPVDASAYFGQSLSPFIAALAQADLSRPLAESGLPPELQRATILQRGKLTPPYQHLESELK